MSNPEKETILEQAQKLVDGNRREDYGDLHESFNRVAAMWSLILEQPITSQEVAMMMIGFKIVREMNKPKKDNRIDICGYTYCLDQLEDNKGKEK